MERPEDLESFTAFQANGITFYVENRVLEEYLKDGKTTFHLDEYGSFDLIIPGYEPKSPVD
jgi:hypothetical protein